MSLACTTTFPAFAKVLSKRPIPIAKGAVSYHWLSHDGKSIRSAPQAIQTLLQYLVKKDKSAVLPVNLLENKISTVM